MDAFIDTARRRSPIRESMPVHVRPTLFIRMMWVSTDIDYVVGHRISTSSDIDIPDIDRRGDPMTARPQPGHMRKTRLALSGACATTGGKITVDDVQ
jgi:hypothetical protein